MTKLFTLLVALTWALACTSVLNAAGVITWAQ